MAEKVAMNRISELQSGGLFSLKVIQSLKKRQQRYLYQFQSRIKQLKEHELNKKEERRILFLRCFLIEKSLYYDMFFKGHLSEQTYRSLNQEIELQIDMMRSQGKVSEKAPISLVKKMHLAVINLLSQFQVFEWLADRLRISQTIYDYEEAWGLHQGCVTVLDYLDSLQTIESVHADVIDELKRRFLTWQQVTAHYLDSTAEQFPEFVHDMQYRLGLRLLLHSKLSVIEQEASQGIIQDSISESLLTKYWHALHKLKHSRPEKLVLDPHEIIQRVPFFKMLPKDEIDDFVAMLEVKHFPANEIVIREGEKDNVFYLIMRGVLRVVKNNQEVATLIAGEFFGEISLIYNVERTATCITKTPCILHVIDSANFEKLSARYPEIRKQINVAAKKRLEEQ